MKTRIMIRQLLLLVIGVTFGARSIAQEFENEELLESTKSGDNAVLAKLVIHMMLKMQEMELELSKMKEQYLLLAEKNTPLADSSSSSTTNRLYRQHNMPTELETPVVPAMNISTVDQILKLFVRRSCHEWLQSGFAKSGMYSIDPDGQGYGDPPFLVYCDMITGFTFINHNKEGEQEATPCSGPLCYKETLTYPTSDTQIRALIHVSESCQQFIKFDCLNSPLQFEDTDLAYWVGRDGKQHSQWAGDDMSGHTCACGLSNSCVNPREACNCDASLPNVWVSDSGYISNSTALPIQEVVFGTKDSATFLQMNYSIGPLRCHGSNALPYPTSCLHLFLQGFRRSGWYILGQPDSFRFSFCDMQTFQQPAAENKEREPVEFNINDISEFVLSNLQSKGFSILKNEQVKKMQSSWKSLEERLENNMQFINETFMLSNKAAEEEKIKQETRLQVIKNATDTNTKKLAVIEDEVEAYDNELDIVRYAVNANKDRLESIEETVKANENSLIDLQMLKSNVSIIHSHMNTKIAFAAVIQKDVTDEDTVVKYDKVNLNLGDGYNPSTGEFTAPVGGVYYIAAYARKKEGKNLYYILRKNGENFSVAVVQTEIEEFQTTGTAVIVDLKANDKMDVYIDDGGIVQGSHDGNYFMGYLIYET